MNKPPISPAFPKVEDPNWAVVMVGGFAFVAIIFPIYYFLLYCLIKYALF